LKKRIEVSGEFQAR